MLGDATIIGEAGGPGDAIPLERIARALERLVPAPRDDGLPADRDAAIWSPTATRRLVPVDRVAAIDLALLRGIDRQRDALLANTRRFADGLPANDVLLWGARGMGKSSLVKAVHASLLAADTRLLLVEIRREDVATMPDLLAVLAALGRRTIVYCDDLSFEGQDADYKALKAVLEGGLAGRPDDVLFYATSNRRHLMPRAAIENERAEALSPGETVEEKVSLSDRFGLWLGFHGCDQPTYLAMIDGYAAAMGVAGDRTALHRRALAWSMQRGARSGRVAAQFMRSEATRPLERGSASRSAGDDNRPRTPLTV